MNKSALVFLSKLESKIKEAATLPSKPISMEEIKSRTEFLLSGSLAFQSAFNKEFLEITEEAKTFLKNIDKKVSRLLNQIDFYEIFTLSNTVMICEQGHVKKAATFDLSDLMGVVSKLNNSDPGYYIIYSYLLQPENYASLQLYFNFCQRV